MLVELVFVKCDFFLSDSHVVGGLADLRFIQFPAPDIKRLHTDFSDPSQ
jgi:hypothetical protein